MKVAKVKIYGHGWVGKAMKQLFPDALVHDPDQGLINTEKADVAFICVPTPNLEDGSLDCSIVEEVLEQAQEPLLIIRSTVMPGFCDRQIRREQIVFQPEYLGETVAHPLLDPTTRQFLILGGPQWATNRAVELYQKVYNANIDIRETTALEAEVIKLSENRAIMFKVAQCQELYDACEKAGVNYNTVRQAVYGDDPRFNLWWTFVYPEARGANSKCIPKDVLAWRAWAESIGYKPEITDMMLKRNEKWLAQNSQ